MYKVNNYYQVKQLNYFKLLMKFIVDYIVLII